MAIVYSRTHAAHKMLKAQVHWKLGVTQSAIMRPRSSSDIWKESALAHGAAGTPAERRIVRAKKQTQKNGAKSATKKRVNCRGGAQTAHPMKHVSSVRSQSASSLIMCARCVNNMFTLMCAGHWVSGVVDLEPLLLLWLILRKRGRRGAPSPNSHTSTLLGAAITGFVSLKRFLNLSSALCRICKFTMESSFTEKSQYYIFEEQGLLFK